MTDGEVRGGGRLVQRPPGGLIAMMSVEMSMVRHFQARKLLGRNERASPRHQTKLRRPPIRAREQEDGPRGNRLMEAASSRSAVHPREILTCATTTSCSSRLSPQILKVGLFGDDDRGRQGVWGGRRRRHDCHWRLVTRVIVALTCHDLCP